MRKKKPLFAPNEHISVEALSITDTLERVAKRYIDSVHKLERESKKYKSKKKVKGEQHNGKNVHDNEGRIS